MGAAAGVDDAGGGSLARHLALTDGAGLSALHLAAQWGMEAVAEQLLAAGAGEQAGRHLRWWEHCPVHWHGFRQWALSSSKLACSNPVCELRLKHGSTHQTSLLHRCSFSTAADPNQRSACRRRLTPAHLAARWGHTAVLQVLQRHGGDLGARCDGLGWTPLQEAEEWRRASCAVLLRGGGPAEV